jgi:hypothetical protein
VLPKARSSDSLSGSDREFPSRHRVVQSGHDESSKSNTDGILDGARRLPFGWGNWTGLAATVVVLVLLVTSNDAALRILKARRWKLLQRVNYLFIVLVVLHAFFYGAFLRMNSAFTALLLCVVVWTI